VKIRVEGTDETKKIGDLSWATDDEANGEEMNFSSLSLYDIGSHVKVTDKSGKCRYYGVIVSMEENVRPPHSYKAMDFSYNLKSDEIIQFKKLPADEAVKRLLKRSDIACSVCPIPTKITKIYKGTTIEILKDILKKAKKDQGKSYYFEVIGTKVVVSEKRKKKINPQFIMSADGAISRSIEDLKNEVKIVKNNKVLAVARDDSSIKRIGTVRAIDDSDISKAKAVGEAKTQLAKLNRSKNTKQVTLLVEKGYWHIRKNRLIMLNGGGLKGWYNIRTSTHSIEGNIHKVDIEVEWSGKF
jgi:hypothetical protein